MHAIRPAAQPTRLLAPYLADDTLIMACRQGAQQGCLDGYDLRGPSLGSTCRTSLGIANYMYGQVMHHIGTRLKDPTFLKTEPSANEQRFSWIPVQNQGRIINLGRYPHPVRILGRSGTLNKNGYFELKVGPLTAGMLQADHRKYSPQLLIELLDDLHRKEDYAEENFQDIYVIYDFVIRFGRDPYLTVYLAFPSPSVIKGERFPYLDYEVIFNGEIGPNKGYTPDVPNSPSPTGNAPFGRDEIDFPVPEKQA